MCAAKSKKKIKETEESASPKEKRAACSTGDWLFFLLRLAAAVSSGLLLSAAFPPLEKSWLAWFALVPLLVVPTPRRMVERVFVGFLFGYVHFATAMHWLNEVGMGAGWLLAIYSGLYPMFWYLLVSWWNWQLKEKEARSLPGAGLLYYVQDWKTAISVLAYPIFWVSLEFLRGHLFTGLPWDLVGVSQFQQLHLLRMVPWTGVYGISFVILTVNSVLAVEVGHFAGHFIMPSKRGFPWHCVSGALILVPALLLCMKQDVAIAPNGPQLKCLAIQGNVPQCRFYTPEQLQLALEKYTLVTAEAAQRFPHADLVMWPECAIPAELEYGEYREARMKLHQTVQKPFLIGALRSDPIPGDGDGEKSADFNSVIQFSAAGDIVDYYDKIHCVPFGEYTPFGDQLPWLRKKIDMGRDLTPGKAYHVLALPNGAMAGVNICYEDIFPKISQQFTRNGANILMTVTNDAWYNFSSGARQHLAHAVFRAVENCRPLLRCSNNSYTCYIAPNGKISSVPEGARDGSPFVTAYHQYQVPISEEWGTTFFTRHGDFFAVAVLLSSVLFIMNLCVLAMLSHRHNMKSTSK